MSLHSDKVEILTKVCEDNGITLEELTGPSRRTEYVRARKEVAILLKEKTPLTLSEIGRVLGRDHSTVIHALRKP